MRRFAAVLVMVVVLAGCGRPAEDATGAELYAQLCASCHAPDLSGGVGPPLGPDSSAAAESDEYLAFTITQGRGRMPSFATTLDDAQVDRLVVFLRDAQGQ